MKRRGRRKGSSPCLFIVRSHSAPDLFDLAKESSIRCHPPSHHTGDTRHPQSGRTNCEGLLPKQKRVDRSILGSSHDSGCLDTRSARVRTGLFNATENHRPQTKKDLTHFFSSVSSFLPVVFSMNKRIFQSRWGKFQIENPIQSRRSSGSPNWLNSRWQVLGC